MTPVRVATPLPDFIQDMLRQCDRRNIMFVYRFSSSCVRHISYEASFHQGQINSYMHMFATELCWVPCI